MEILKNYIGGQWVESLEKQAIDVINPAKQEVLAKVPFGTRTAKDAEDAVRAASQALMEWRHTPAILQPV